MRRLSLHGVTPGERLKADGVLVGGGENTRAACRGRRDRGWGDLRSAVEDRLRDGRERCRVSPETLTYWRRRLAASASPGKFRRSVDSTVLVVSCSQAWVDRYPSSLEYPKLLTLVPAR